MSKRDALVGMLPTKMQRRVEPLLEAVGLLGQVNNVNTVGSFLPSLFRGFVLRQGRNQQETSIHASYPVHFDWEYRSEFPEMKELYQRAKQNQWDSDFALDWSTSVDPLNPEVPLLPNRFWDDVEFPRNIKLSNQEKQELTYCVCSWMLSQFLHGEQGALYAAAQVTESVQWMDGKLYGATQVMDEGRHVEVFHRYIDEKLNKLYVINDNLFVIIDALVSDSRWDMKFLGMQIMVEGLALGAFGTLYRWTKEPLLKNLLRYVIQDEARHVHFGVLALREYFTEHLSDAERHEREDWAFEVALLMRNRFLAHEVYEEWFEGMFSRKQWNEIVNRLPLMQEFREVMFCRLIPNLRYIGLLSDRMMGHYERAGLWHFADGATAAEISGEQILAELDGIDPSTVVAQNASQHAVGEPGHEGHHHSHDDHDDHDDIPDEMKAWMNR